MDIRVHTVGLIISCPMLDASEDCPYNKYRNEPLNKLNEIVEKIPYDEIIKQEQHHKRCLNQRIKLISTVETCNSVPKSTNNISLPIYHFSAI